MSHRELHLYEPEVFLSILFFIFPVASIFAIMAPSTPAVVAQSTRRAHARYHCSTEYASACHLMVDIVYILASMRLLNG